MKSLPFGILLLLLSAAPAAGQFYPAEYRPTVHWQQLQTDHFKIVFPAGEDSAAWNTAAILERDYLRAKALTGGELNRFPVILKNYSDRSNGFVTSLHFRSEFDLAPMAGKTLNPLGKSWLETVAPHELVHALQYSNLGKFTLPRILSLFSPDMGRSFHGGIPSGINEGLAVFHESGGGGGRGHYPFFTNRFEAVFHSPRRWSMGQMVQRTIYTRPFDRHYVGGYAFTRWLHSEYGDEVTRDAIDFYLRYPFLGYGVALRHATGKWPSRLYRGMAEDNAADVSGEDGASFHKLADLPGKGASMRNPRWLNDSTLVMYGSFYNARRGFYRYDLEEGTWDRLITTNSVGDYHYDLSEEGLTFAFYRSDPRYNNVFLADLLRYDFSTGSVTSLSDRQRLYSPVQTGRGLLALQTRGASNRLVRLASDSVEPVVEIEETRLVEIAAHAREPDRLAVVAHDGTRQALWVTGTDDIGEQLAGPPDISFGEGSVFDPRWHPDENRLLFSSDFSGVLQLYELDLADETVRQITDSRFNAFEGSWSPSGERIAFILQDENRMVPALLGRNRFLNRPIPSDLWRDGAAGKPLAISRNESVDRSEWEQSSYSSGIDWLRPRMFLPVVNEISNRNIHEIGLSFHSNDLLHSQSYRFDLTGVQDRLWYDFVYRNAGFFPGYEFSLSSSPSFRDFEFEGENGGDPFVRTMLRQQRSLSVSVPVPMVLENNVRFTSLFFRPTLERSQIRYFELHHAGDPASDFGSVISGGLYGSLSWRLQQNIRDVQPNSGLALYSQVEHYFSSDPLILNTPEGRHRLTFVRPTAFRAGLFSWFSPLRRWNQSLRIGLEGLTQSVPVWDNQTVVSGAFSGPVFPLSNNLISFSTRYTIPLTWPDDGGLLLPFYLGNLYLSAFTNTVADPRRGLGNDTRSVYGLGIRSHFRFSNLSFELGIGVGYEPSRGDWQVLFGPF